MDKHAVKKLLPLFAVLLILLACELPALPLPAESAPSPASVSLETIVVATAGAAQTQTALVVPTATPTSTPTLVPTSTYTETPTPTETIIFNIPTSTQPFVTQSAGSNCQIIAQSPVNNAVMDSREAFTVEWTLRNTGSETWLHTDNDFYHSGDRDMHATDILDLPNSVGASGEVTLGVEMFAPEDSGSYTSTWSLGSNKRTLCRVSITIVVK